MDDFPMEQRDNSNPNLHDSNTIPLVSSTAPDRQLYPDGAQCSLTNDQINKILFLA